jgi:hypothetical protein
MVSGKWGSGKTHLLAQVGDALIARGLTGDKNKPIYITLYGVRDAAEIGDQFYQQLHPILASKGARLVGAVMKGLLRTSVKIDLGEISKGDLSVGSQLPDVKISELVEGANQRVIIFDDFERARMTPAELLGYINPLVEHDGCKVIIVANEEEIKDDDYWLRKEKTVGQTLEVVADVADAFPAFMTEVDTRDLKDFYIYHRQAIEAVFTDSGLENLRLLKQFFWDFERYWAELTDLHRKHDMAMLEVMTLLCALTLELRSGRIKRSEFDPDGFSAAIIVGKKESGDKQQQPYQVAKRRYTSVDFESALVTHDTIYKMIFSSMFPRDDIRAALNAHPYFAKPEQLPSWRALWFGFELPAEEIPDVVRRFNEDFETEKFVQEPEVLHVIGLSLWLSEIGEPAWPADTVLSRIKGYIDRVYDERPSAATDVVPPSRLHVEMGGAYGLGYRKSDDPRFQELASYLAMKARAWRVRGFPRVAEELLELMSVDADAFLRKICATATGPATYARLPVVSAIPPNEFVSRFVYLNYESRKDVLLALSMRYEHVDMDKDLATERPWIQEVYDRLIAHANSLDPIPRAFLRERIDTYLAKIVSASRDVSGGTAA